MTLSLETIKQLQDSTYEYKKILTLLSAIEDDGQIWIRVKHSKHEIDKHIDEELSDYVMKSIRHLMIQHLQMKLTHINNYIKAIANGDIANET